VCWPSVGYWQKTTLHTLLLHMQPLTHGLPAARSAWQWSVPSQKADDLHALASQGTFEQEVRQCPLPSQR